MSQPKQPPSTRQLKRKDDREFGQLLGRLFELGFNVGCLTYLRQHSEIKNFFGSLYQEDLQHLHLPELRARMHDLTHVISPTDHTFIDLWTLFFLQKGQLAGLNLLNEYFQVFKEDQPEFVREVIYLQCNFYGQNSLGIYEKNPEAAVAEMMQQFQAQGYQLPPAQTLLNDYYQKRGLFLQADTLMLLKYNNRWRILCIDLSVFGIKKLQDASDLTRAEPIYNLLQRELSYVRSKSSFSQLSIDSDNEVTPPSIAPKLQTYFAAIKSKDKESAKLIQAASYAESFYAFLLKQQILTTDDDIQFNIVGYTDRNINTLSLNKDQLPLLKICADIYRRYDSKEEIDDARDHVLESINKATRYAFGQGQELANQLSKALTGDDRIHWVHHHETLDNFVNTRTPLDSALIPQDIKDCLPLERYDRQNILDIHAALVEQELESTNVPYLFLTGNPGIGKTTRIVRFLKEHAHEGFFFFYVSPRKQVNLDIIAKFHDPETGPACPELLALTTNSTIIRSGGSHKTVHYYSEQRCDTFQLQGVKFIHIDSEEAKQQQAQHRHMEEIQEGLLIDKGEKVKGVLDSLSTAIQQVFDASLSNNLIATVAIQSLKKPSLAHKPGKAARPGDKTTLDHLDRVLKDIYDRATGTLPTPSTQANKPLKYLFFMIDEVTGDESGAAFIDKIHSLLIKNKLLGQNSPIETKIIVADASIIDPRIIQTHLSTTTYEPDKIYFRRLKLSPLPISRIVLANGFKRQPAVSINANAFPASKLHINYHLGLEIFRYQEENFQTRQKKILATIQAEIIVQIEQVLRQPDDKQLLIYIQDKPRLFELIRQIKSQHPFVLYEHYLEIHSNLSEMEKQQITKHQNEVPIVFMTASASRGLSFKKATRIIIEVPHFNIEQNLMEILQVIYRGRGGDYDLEEKTLDFYLYDQIIYTESEDRPIAVRERQLHLLNILLILKTAIMTRICGAGQLGRSGYYTMIPVGGKNVTSAGESFTTRMSHLIKELERQSQRYFGDKNLIRVQQLLTQALKESKIMLVGSTDPKKKIRSYRSLIETFSDDFIARANRGFDHLLDIPVLEEAYISGGLLVVPAGNKSVQEAYWLDVEKHLRPKEGEKSILTLMKEISHDRRYSQDLQQLMQDAITLIKLLEEGTKGGQGRYEQESFQSDQHYTFPLITFLTIRTMQQYFELQPEPDENGLQFRRLLAQYIYALYPADSLLPIGSGYKHFPYLVFRSPNLQEARHKMFTDRYLFMSHELNILNMLLSEEN